ncbi:MAG: ATP-dependent DNA helicase RecG [Candidatus Levybacteria bacterium]|nr:ATP-dependent DNA helicase RecG [Candidatus Levybacteria bacterium]
MDLKTPVKDLGRIYKMRERQLEKLGIKILEDFLYHIPSRYEDYSVISKISEIQAGEVITIQGTVIEIKNEYTKNYKKLQKAKVSDNTGTIDVIWFNQPFLVKNIRVNENISLSGKVNKFLNKLVIESPEYEVILNTTNYNIKNHELIHTGRLVPVYPETRGISSKWLRRQIYKILNEYKHNLIEYIPYSLIKNNDLMNFTDAIEQIHFPKENDLIEKARYRLSFDELFFIQLAAMHRRKEWEKNLTGNPLNIAKFKKNIEEFWEKLPFELTNAQKNAVKDIFADLAGKKPMNRLLEGDVGSGKTVVSTIAMYLAYLNGYQSVLMAPTEILAQQHYKTISDLLEPLGVKVELVTGSKKLSTFNSQFSILIGTHAVLSEKIKFDKLGLIVIDEQQRFGVEQRGIIKQKGENPHLLVMTATPIPRTVALTMYGDLDLSYLDEMPIGRKKVKTWLVPQQKRESAYKWIADEIKKNKTQVFIICPFIEESESMQTVKAATKEYEKLRKEIFPDLKLGLLHGKLKGKEKSEVLNKFKNKEFDILVATPVVEVGIDIPNATIIVIEASDRFGLSSLHQLRGRVGRSDMQSYCLLFTESKSEQTINRLRAMETMFNGAELSELDLKLRGPGELYGTLQHGIPELKVASFSNFKLIEKTKKEAENIFPNLSKYPLLEEKLKSITIENVSPN